MAFFSTSLMKRLFRQHMAQSKSNASPLMPFRFKKLFESFSLTFFAKMESSSLHSLPRGGKTFAFSLRCAVCTVFCTSVTYVHVRPTVHQQADICMGLMKCEFYYCSIISLRPDPSVGSPYVRHHASPTD